MNISVISDISTTYYNYYKVEEHDIVAFDQLALCWL